MASNALFDQLDDLLVYVQSGQVIPVVGPELVQVECDGESITLEQWLARQLVREFGLDPGQLPERYELSDVAWQFLLRNPRSRPDLYARIRRLLRSASFPTPEPLRQLARVTDFTLLVTTTCDTLLERALAEERPGAPVRSHAWSLTSWKKAGSNEPDDLAPDAESRALPTVFHLFGSVASQGGSFVTNDEEALEFLQGLQAGAGRPQHLFDRLREASLLLLGCNMPDWLARFFLRILAQKRMLEDVDRKKYVADRRTPQDPGLVVFLRNTGVEVIQAGTAADFVAALHARWLAEREGQPAPAAPAPATVPGSVFLSYAGENREAVLRLKEAFERAGIQVWFDQGRLQAGEAFNEVIKARIYNSTLFIPCISAATCQAYRENSARYFKQEWGEALMVFRPYPFLAPVVLDATAANDPFIPPIISRTMHIQPCPGGSPPAEFVEQLKSRLIAAEAEREAVR